MNGGVEFTYVEDFHTQCLTEKVIAARESLVLDNNFSLFEENSSLFDDNNGKFWQNPAFPQ
ncbi:hypothetical protein MNBD_GAMMA02-917 [hydrothermal vent metagenome]|uniref:Uncharacterized protein n=2 Tax=hydrothermal vent metagenome TaxID=652676 RepID=A0A3B0WEY0_9ZZZZ